MPTKKSTEEKATDQFPYKTVGAWSNRILVASLAGILSLTLFPFRLDLGATLASNRSPLLLGKGLHFDGTLHIFLNILLFAPLGFGLANLWGRRGKSLLKTFVCILMASAILSYMIEFLQIYIPTRDSGWDDVCTNTIGSAAGFILWMLMGEALLRQLSRWELRAQDCLSFRRIAIILVIYFSLCLAVSAPLQEETRLNNWDGNSALILGNDDSGQNPWKGQIFGLQVWDRAQSDKLARQLTSGNLSDHGHSDALASYEFSAARPLHDQNGFLPPLSWTPNPPFQEETEASTLVGKTWLRSQGTIAGLARELEKTNQMSVRIDCAPHAVSGSKGDIVSISNRAGLTDFEMRQDGADLVLVLRNGLSSSSARLDWRVLGVFVSHQAKSILVSYDGSGASLFVDGRREPDSYYLSPGAALVHKVIRIKTAELVGYFVLYDSLVFAPVGFLLGFASRMMSANKIFGSILLGGGFILPPILLEALLVWVSGRPISVALVAIGFLMIVAGFLWINADRRTSATRTFSPAGEAAPHFQT